MPADKNSLSYADSVLATYLTHVFDQPETSADVVAGWMGHPNSRLLTSVARGERRLALDNVPALARVLGGNPLHILAMGMRTYSPQLADLIDLYYSGAEAEKLTAAIEVEP